MRVRFGTDKPDEALRRNIHHSIALAKERLDFRLHLGYPASQGRPCKPNSRLSPAWQRCGALAVIFHRRATLYVNIHLSLEKI
jgi:hypothetical protein